VLGFTAIRSWNRISVYLAFFALTAVGIWLTRALARRWSGRSLRGASIALAGVLILLAAYDQTPAGPPSYAAVAARWGNDRGFVRETEREMGADASIFQLPYVPFPEGPYQVFNMVDYDHLSGYLHSDTLDWSYAGMKGRETEWQPALLAQPLTNAVTGMGAAGFDGLYVDRAGYPDSAGRLEDELRRLLGPPLFESADGRLVMYDLRPVRERLRTTFGPVRLASLRRSVLHPPLTVFGDGFSGSISGMVHERDAESSWNFAAQDAEMQLENPTKHDQTVRISFRVDAFLVGSVGFNDSVTVRGLGPTVRLPTNDINDPSHFDRRVTLRPGTTRVRFSSSNRSVAPGDHHFRVVDFELVPPKLAAAARSVTPASTLPAGVG
jgi:phosphoglycerol transferase